ncbi:MAG: PepSY domain-containing protein, partial [Rhodospirillaceae bacterium]|nr:PepSY domain-containing protein [Rhodospirillaceae bacterium]
VAFRPELSRLIHPEAMVVAPAPHVALQTLVDSARAVNPAKVLTRIDYPWFEDSPYIARLEDQTTDQVTLIALDPGTGRVLRHGGLSDWPIELAFEIHFDLVSGDPGERVVGLVGLFIFSMAVMGLLIWWPGWRGVKRSFAVKFSSGSIRATRDLHRVYGTVIAAVILLGAGTGIGLAWKPWFQAGLDKVTVMADWPPKASPGTCEQTLSADDVAAAAQTYEDGARLKSVRFTARKTGPVTVHLHSKTLSRPRAADRVLVDACTGVVLGAKDADLVPWGDQVLDWLLPIHTGEWLGLPGRILMLVMALSLIGLGVTGYVIWSARNAKSRTKQTAATAEAR